MGDGPVFLWTPLAKRRPPIESPTGFDESFSGAVKQQLGDPELP